MIEVTAQWLTGQTDHIVGHGIARYRSGDEPTGTLYFSATIWDGTRYVTLTTPTGTIARQGGRPATDFQKALLPNALPIIDAIERHAREEAS